MPEKLHIKIESEYLYAEVSGRYHARMANEFFEEIFKQSIEHKKLKILIDARMISGKLSVVDRYEFGAKQLSDQRGLRRLCKSLGGKSFRLQLINDR